MFATRSEKRPYYLSFWVFVWGEIAPKSLKNPFGIVIKICSIFVRFFNGFGSILDPLGDPWEWQGMVNEPCFFCLASPWNPKWLQDLAQKPLGHPRTSNFYDFCKISDRIWLRFFIIRWFRHGGGKAEGNWIR